MNCYLPISNSLLVLPHLTLNAKTLTHYCGARLALHPIKNCQCTSIKTGWCLVVTMFPGHTNWVSVAYSMVKQGKPGILSHVNGIRIERTVDNCARAQTQNSKKKEGFRQITTPIY